MKYRADIDGLRAIAVLSVVLFHLELTAFSGGYVGVDIFFVISGYLITSIIKSKYEHHDFKLSDFYARRIRRLLPPLIATVAATGVGAALIMTPYDLVSFSRSAAAALFSLSNIVFYLESGYWDTASELKPLLHTWSLGVEEQFYLFWPALIVGLLSIRRSVSLGLSLTLITVLGALLCIAFTQVDQSASFYLLPFRVFQFAAGALLIPLAAALQTHNHTAIHRLPTLAFWPGLLCIAVSVVAFDGDTNFPGWAVLLPTMGAALVLVSTAASRELHGPAKFLMENRLSVWLGRVSYSMYLVHWPIIALFRYQYGTELTTANQFLLGVATLLATLTLHYGIERRYYHRADGIEPAAATSANARFALRTLVIAGVLALVATSAWQGDGWAWRFPTLALSAEQIKQGEQDRFKRLPKACILANPLTKGNCDFSTDLQLLVLGNSTELDGFNFINSAYGDDSNINIIQFGSTNRCADWREENGRFLTSDEQCQNQLDALFEPAMIDRLDIVLYSANRPYAFNKSSLLAMLQALKSLNPKIRIVTLGGYINNKRPCSFYFNQTNTTDTCALPENVSYFEDDTAESWLIKPFRKIESHYIDRIDLLCKNRVLQTCRTRTEDGIPGSYDGIHHSLEFAEMSGKLFAKKHPDFLKELAAP